MLDNRERKIIEACLASEYERQFTKDQILEKYLNGIFYGNNAVGIQAAALTFFNKPAAKLELHEGALLAGMPQAPSAYDPFANPGTATQRRNEVLDRMREQDYITREEARVAKAKPLGLERGRAYEIQREGYVFDYVREQLIDRYGEEEVQRGGFQVFTTIDPDLQQFAEEAIDNQLGLDDDPAAAIVMIDSRTGFIRAMASSVPYGDGSQFNFAAQALRQPGSTFKTFVLTRAIEEGINPYRTIYDSKRLKFTDPQWGPIDVSTYSNSYRGPVPVSSATLSSDNSVYTQLTLDVGPTDVKGVAERMGIPTERDLPAVPSLGLGSGEVAPLDMAVAYSPLSNGGLRVNPIAISRIKRPDGTEEQIEPPSRERVFSDGVAYEVTRILQDNVRAGTGGRSRIDRPTAGKTGTTDNFVDAWYVGYTPRYVTAVWVGYPNDDGSKRSMYSVHGQRVAGGTFPAAIWGEFMQPALDHLNEPADGFPATACITRIEPLEPGFSKSCSAQQPAQNHRCDNAKHRSSDCRSGALLAGILGQITAWCARWEGLYPRQSGQAELARHDKGGPGPLARRGRLIRVGTRTADECGRGARVGPEVGGPGNDKRLLVLQLDLAMLVSHSALHVRFERNPRLPSQGGHP